MLEETVFWTAVNWNWGVSSTTNQKQNTEISETEKVAELKIRKHFKHWGVLFCPEGFLRYESGVLNRSLKCLHCLFRASWRSKELAQHQQIHYSIIYSYAYNRLNGSYMFWRYNLACVCVLCPLFSLTLALESLPVNLHTTWFNIQQLYFVIARNFCVLYGSRNKQ